MIYYVNHNACPTLEDAEEVALLYRAAGIAVDILTEEEYFEIGFTGSAKGRQRLHELVERVTRTLQ